MAKLETTICPEGPRTIKADGARVGEVVLAAPNHTPVMRTSQKPSGTPSTYQFVMLGNAADVSPGTLVYYLWDTELYEVQSAEMRIVR